MENGQPRPLYVIADEIKSDWGTRVNFAAHPYLAAMSQLSVLTDTYGMDNAKGIIQYFLSNATSWRGDVARRVKAELRSMITR